MTETKEAPAKEAPSKVVEPETADPRPKLVFDPPGAQRKLKNLFTVKAFDKDGTLVQLPVADQINNNVAGSDQLIGLRHYVRKGFDVLWDFEHNVGAYCPMGDCFAKWNDTYRGYCSAEHMSTMDIKENPGPFSKGATTSLSAWTRS